MASNKDFTLDKLAVIVPFNEYSEENAKLLENAINSVPENVDIIFITVEGVTDMLTEDVLKRFKDVIFKTEGDTDFCSMVNQAVHTIDSKYEWVSILEFDDSYNLSVLSSNIEKYIKAKSEYSIFLSLQYLVDFNQQMFIGFVNEMPLAMPKDGVFGALDEDMLQDVYNLNLTGAIIKRDVFADLKPQIKIYFWYEWIMRVMRQGAKTFTIPKVFYNHNLMREGSLFAEYQKSVTGQENNYWLNVAKESSKLDSDDTQYAYQQAKSAE